EDLSHTFLSIAQENQIQYSADVVTNGYFLTKDAFEKLLSWNVRQFMVTIDGVGEMHDRTRHLAGGGGTFDQIIENLRAVKECSADF
ncbi:radical SAM/SPASM domain-containing protein, partial [Anaerostipes hadrus]|nr:radical SAM/SPASM domain-containing protein [Anaerostipes hadrus]